MMIISDIREQKGESIEITRKYITFDESTHDLIPNQFVNMVKAIQTWNLSLNVFQLNSISEMFSKSVGCDQPRTRTIKQI